MAVVTTCPRCLRPVPADAPFGECPGCLLLLGLGSTPDGDGEATAAVSVATATVSASGFASADPDATLSLGSGQTGKSPDWPTIPHYEIIDLLGEGGGGRVFKAKQLKAGGRLVAIKVLHGLSKLERERMKREAESLGKLSHPNIVTIYDVDECSEGPYFTMEYLPNGTLGERIKKQPPDPMEAARIVEAVARGVAAAHAHREKILHRDLKPSNVLLATDGTPKVSDFGLAKFADESGDAAALERLTPTHAVIGTPPYMAPEQAAGRTKDIDERTDVYGLGAILYQCLTGRPPFTGESRQDTMMQVIRDDVVRPRAIRRDIPRDLEAVCLKCLEKGSFARYPKAADVVRELERFQKGEPTEARPLGRIGWTWRRLKRNRRTVATVAGMLAFVAAAWLAISMLKRPPAPPEDEAPKAYRELAAALKGTEPVVLVGETGSPRYKCYTWDEGAAPFAISPYHDDVLTFQSVSVSRLQLVPADLLPGRFILEAEIRHVAGQRATSTAGLYFDKFEWTPPGGQPLKCWHQVVFNDFPLAVPFKQLANEKQRIYARLRVARVEAGRDEAMRGDMLTDIPIAPPPLLEPRGWRKVRLTIGPDAVEYALIEGRPVQFRRPRISAEELTKLLRGGIRRSYPQLNVAESELPAWGTRGSLGLQVTDGEVSFKNVRITPLVAE